MCQEEASKKRGSRALCAINLPTRCLCLVGKQVPWYLISRYCVVLSLSFSIMIYKDKNENTKNEILKSLPTRHKWWNKC